MSNQPKIRKADREDLPAVLRLYAQKEIDDGDILSVKEANKVFEKFQQYPDYSLYVATIDDTVIGTFALLVMDNIAHKGKKSGIAEDVIVDEAYRSRGIGRKMMEFAIDICRQKKCYKLTLSSGKHREKSHQFYENLGFNKHGYSFLIEL